MNIIYYIYIYVYMYIYVYYICTSIYIYIHAHVYTHQHCHTYIHTPILIDTRASIFFILQWVHSCSEYIARPLCNALYSAKARLHCVRAPLCKRMCIDLFWMFSKCCTQHVRTRYAYSQPYIYICVYVYIYIGLFWTYMRIYT